MNVKWLNQGLMGACCLFLAVVVACRPTGSLEPGSAADMDDSAVVADDSAVSQNEADQPADENAASGAESSASVDAPEAPADDEPSNVVLLGDPQLTAGIPGEGPLTEDEIAAWLDDEKNHQSLQVELPMGLSLAAANITGLDENPMTRAKVELGRQLYFDRRLSADASVSCADCHHPDEGFGRHTRFGVGIDGQEGNRNSPVSYNRILSGPQFWDGRAASLEEQAVGPIANPIEMGNTHEVAVQAVADIPGYKMQFEKIFPNGVTIDNIGWAIATFERAIVTAPAPYDYHEALRRFENAYALDIANPEAFKEENPEGYEQYQQLLAEAEAHPFSEAAERGRELFFSDKAGCSACHAGANFTDEQYHNIGVGMDAEDPDLGRYEVTKDEKDKGAFKTPTLRNVALSAPYMHDGSQETLDEVVEFYAKGGHPNPHLSDKIKKLELTEQDKKDLVAFMHALTSEFPPIEMARLPQ